MAEVTLDYLGQQIQRMLDNQRDHTAKFSEVIERIGRLETLVAGIHSDFAGLSVRVDRLSERIDRVERRLEIGAA